MNGLMTGILTFFLCFLVLKAHSHFTSYIDEGNAELDWIAGEYERKLKRDMEKLGEKVMRAYSAISDKKLKQLEKGEGIAFIQTGVEHTFLITEAQLLALTGRENHQIYQAARQDVLNWYKLLKDMKESGIPLESMNQDLQEGAGNE